MKRRRGVENGARGWQLLALVLALAAAVVLLVVPIGRRDRASTTGEATIESTTLLQLNGATGLVPLAVPVLLTAFPLLASRSRRRALSLACTVSFGVAVVLSIPSIGLFFASALVAAMVACLLSLQSASRSVS